LEDADIAQRMTRVSVGQRWVAARPTKTVVFWSWVACVVLTIAIGFTWGGWMRGATARSMAEAAAEGAVIKHLVPICLAQFNQDPAKDQKLRELKALSTYERSGYVKRQGWATMPGEKQTDDKVSEECAKLIAE
jgi:hypothetical protein